MVDSSTYLPQDVERRQKLAEAMLYGAMKPRTIHNAGEGIAQMAQALLGGLMTRKANEAEATGRKSASDAVARALAGFSAPSDSLPQVSPVTTPTQPQTVSGGGDFTSNSGEIPTNYFNAARASESGGNPNAKNPRSSASGLYQFTTGTWADVARRHPELGLTPDGRSDQQQQEKAMRAFTADNAGKLQAAGVPVTGGSLYAAHFLGSGAAPTVWKAPENALVANFVDPGVIQANPFLQGMTAAQFRNWATSKGGGVAPSGVAENAVTPMGQPNLAANLPPIDPESGMTVDQAALPTARPASLNRTMPMVQALANPTAPVSIPDNNPLRSNQQQSAGDFARADARRRMAMAMSGGQMPSAPPPMAGNGPSAPISQPSTAMGAPMQNAPQQTPQSNPQQGGRLQALMAAAQNPYLTPAQASVINAAIKMEVERSAPQKPEIVTAPDGTILAINPMDAAHPQTVYRGGQKPTDDMREYEFAKSQGYQGSFEQYQRDLKKAGASSTNVSTGTVPQGYQNIYDDQGRLIRQEPIPGGPADKSAQEGAKQDSQAVSTDTILNAANGIRSITTKNPSAIGTSGWVLSNIPSSDAAEVYRQMGVLKANATIENLNAMRRQSPTGGALGNVTQGEGEMLAAKAGALDPRSPYFPQQLADYTRTLLRIVNGKEAGDAIFEEMYAPKKQGAGGVTSGGLKWRLEP